MPWKEIKIELLCLESDWKHEISLCFENENSLYDNFLKPIESAKESDKGYNVTLKVPQGAVSAERHFVKDYQEDRRFELIIGQETIIKNVTFSFEKDNSVVSKNDDLFMKNIEFRFFSRECQSI